MTTKQRASSNTSDITDEERVAIESLEDHIRRMNAFEGFMKSYSKDVQRKVRLFHNQIEDEFNDLRKAISKRHSQLKEEISNYEKNKNHLISKEIEYLRKYKSILISRNENIDALLKTAYIESSERSKLISDIVNKPIEAENNELKTAFENYSNQFDCVIHFHTIIKRPKLVFGDWSIATNEEIMTPRVTPSNLNNNSNTQSPSIKSIGSPMLAEMNNNNNNEQLRHNSKGNLRNKSGSNSASSDENDVKVDLASIANLSNLNLNSSTPSVSAPQSPQGGGASNNGGVSDVDLLKQQIMDLGSIEETEFEELSQFLNQLPSDVTELQKMEFELNKKEKLLRAQCQNAGKLILNIPQKHLILLQQYNEEIQECMVHTLESLSALFPDLMKDILLNKQKTGKNNFSSKSNRNQKNRYKSRYHSLLYRWKDLIELFDHTDLMANILTYDYQNTIEIINETKRKFIKEKYYNSLIEMIKIEDSSQILSPLIKIADWILKLFEHLEMRKQLENIRMKTVTLQEDLETKRKHALFQKQQTARKLLDQALAKEEENKKKKKDKKDKKNKVFRLAAAFDKSVDQSMD